MRKFVKLLVIAALMFAGYGCETPTEKPQGEPQLEVTANNIAGSWKLASLKGGSLAEGSYVYIDFDRADRTFTMYQNTDSHYTRTLTGRYFIYVDEQLGVAVLRGEYDHGAGDWNHRYIVSALTANQMTLTAMDDAEDVCLYERATIPAEIIGE